jgi:hypothetical protein
MAKLDIERRYDADESRVNVDTVEVEVWIDVDRPEACGWGETEAKLVIAYEAHVRQRRVYDDYDRLREEYPMGASTELEATELDEVATWMTSRLELREAPRGHVIRHLTQELMDAAKGEFRSEVTGCVVKDEPFDRHAHELKMAEERRRPESRQAEVSR